MRTIDESLNEASWTCACFQYQDVFQPGSKLQTPFKKLPADGLVKTVNVGGQEVLQVDPKALTLLANQVSTPHTQFNSRYIRSDSYCARPRHAVRTV